jgi:hypothetical protein
MKQYVVLATERVIGDEMLKIVGPFNQIEVAGWVAERLENNHAKVEIKPLQKWEVGSTSDTIILTDLL